MADRALRGMRIGTNSLETEKGVVFAQRFEARYRCPHGHETILPFSVEAEPPAIWECQCGEEAGLAGAEDPEDFKPARTQRTHWDMLKERRTEEELEQLLNEQLKSLRSGQLRNGVHYGH